MDMELYKAILSIDIKNITEDDKEELLGLFMITKNTLIRNRIALMFSDTCYKEAIPYLIKKINKKGHYNDSGTLVYALGELASENQFIPLIRIICKKDYEARQMAYSATEDLLGSISKDKKRKALKILNNHLKKQGKISDDQYKNSPVHFMEATKELLMKK